TGQESERHPAEVRPAAGREPESEKRPEETKRPRRAPCPARLASKETGTPQERKLLTRSSTTMAAARRARPSTGRAKMPTPPRITAAVAASGHVSCCDLRWRTWASPSGSGVSTRLGKTVGNSPEDERGPGVCVACAGALGQPPVFQEELGDVKAVSAPAASPIRCETSQERDRISVLPRCDSQRPVGGRGP